MRPIKAYIVILVYRRNLVTVRYTSFTLLVNVLCVSFVYVFHLVKFVSFCCYRIFPGE